MKNKTVTAVVICGLMALALYGHFFFTIMRPPRPLTTQEKQMIDTLFAATRPQCVGRYLFEVPQSFSNTLDKNIRINKISISSGRLYRPGFVHRIQQREQELLNEKTIDEKDLPFLKQVIRINDNAVIFDRNKRPGVPGFGRTLEGHLYDNGVAFILTQEITDYSDPRYAEERAFYLREEVGRPAWKANNKPQKLAELQNVMSRLSGRHNEDIPVTAGTCIPDGFIRDAGGKQDERVTFIYPYQKEFSLIVSTNTWLGDPKSLLERSNEIQPYISKLNGQSLRKGKITMAGVETDQWLVVSPTKKHPENPSASLLFKAIANEKVVDFHHPIINVMLSNVWYPPPSLSDAELVDIWDRIIRTFRLRPGAFESNK